MRVFITFVPLKLFVENIGENFRQRRFVGLCDLDTLKKWNPCPFSSDSKNCSPGSSKTYSSFCTLHSMMTQPRCDCNCSLKSHELESMPGKIFHLLFIVYFYFFNYLDFPMCLLMERSCTSKRSPIFRRSARTAPVINNCIQCMTKHPVKTPLPYMLPNKSGNFIAGC